MTNALQKVGRLLVERGLLTPEQLATVLREAARGKTTLGEIVVSHGYSDRDRLTRTLKTLGALRFRCPEDCPAPSPEPLGAAWSDRCPTCGASLESEDPVISHGAPSPAPQPIIPLDVAEASRDPRRVLGKYVLLRELGRGGMAVVYKAWDNSLHHYVALKLIRTQDLGLSDRPQDGAVQEFLREARTAVKLQHPNIVRIFDVGCHDDRHYLTMEYVEGRSLAELLKSPSRKGLAFYAAPQKFLKILREVADALDHAHHHRPPIIHRDIKPGNILVDPSGRACVVDFGIAKEMKSGAQLTLSGMTKGTPSYMAPEQATGRPVDPRTDVHALGAILYEFLSGRPPFTAPTEREILNKVVNEEPEAPSKVVRSRGLAHTVIPDLERICLRALQKDKEQRYPSVREFAADLDRFLTGDAVAARPVRGWERRWRWIRRNPAVSGPAAAAVILAIVAVLALLRRPATERMVERVVVENETAATARAMDPLVADFKFGQAIRQGEERLARIQGDSERQAVRQRIEELRLQETLFLGLIERLQKGPRTLEELRTRNERLSSVRILDASPSGLSVRVDGRLREIPWAGLEPAQVAALVREAWPDLEGKAALGLGVWCLRHGLINEAAQALKQPGAGGDDPQARRLLQELSGNAAAPDPAIEENVARLKRQALEALAGGDLIVARARYERAITLKADDAEAIRGLAAVAKAEADRKKAEAPTPAPEPQPAAKAAPKAVEEAPKEDLPTLVQRFLKSRGEFMEALKRRDLDTACQIQARKVPGGVASMYDVAGVGSAERPALEALMAQVESWLETNPAAPELTLRTAFEVRDLVAVAILYDDLGAAIDRLAKARTPLVLPSISKNREGILEKGKDGLVFQLGVETAGKSFTLPLRVSMFKQRSDRLDTADVLAILRRDRESRGVSATTGSMLREALLQACEGDGGARAADLPDWAAISRAASIKEAAAMRLDDYRRSLRERPTWTFDFIAPAAQRTWSQGLRFDEEGMLLTGSVNAGTGAIELSPGMRITAKVMVDRVVAANTSRFALCLLEVLPEQRTQWNEVLEFSWQGREFFTHLFSFQRQRERTSSPRMVTLGADRWSEISLEVHPDRLVVFVDGIRIDEMAGAVLGARRLTLTCEQIRVRFSALKAEPLAPSAAEAAEPVDRDAPLANRNEILQMFEDHSYPAVIRALTRQIDAAQARGDDVLLRGYCRYYLGDWDGAITDLRDGLSREPAYPQYAQLFLWVARTRVGDALASPDLGIYFGRLTDPGPQSAWARSIASYLRGMTTHEALLKEAEQGKTGDERKARKCEATYFIGCKLLSQGDAAGAAIQFKACIDTGVTNFLEYKAAKADLDRLKGPSKPPAFEELSAKVAFQVPDTIPDGTWEPYGWSPDGAEAAILADEGGRKRLQWGKRFMILDGTVEPCVGWIPGTGPVYVVRKGATCRVGVGDRLHDPAESVRDLTVAPGRNAVAYVIDVRGEAEPAQILVSNGYRTKYGTVSNPVYGPSGLQELTAVVSTGQKTWLLTGSSRREFRHATPSFLTYSPGGRHFGYAVSNGDNTTIIINGAPAATTTAVSKLRIANNGRYAWVIPDPNSPATKQRAVTAVGPGAAYGEIQSLVLNADGSSVAYVARDGGRSRVVRDSIAGGPFDRIPGRHGGIEQPVYVPSGKSIAYAGVTLKGCFAMMLDDAVVDLAAYLGPPILSPDGSALSYGVLRGRTFYWRTVSLKQRG